MKKRSTSKSTRKEKRSGMLRTSYRKERWKVALELAK